MNPVRTGISDHSEEVMMHLCELADVDAVLDSGYTPVNHALLEKVKGIGVSEFRREREQYDAVIYQIGNNYDHHAYMMPCLREAPGIVVMQDYCLQYLALGYTVGRGDLPALERMLEPVDGTQARAHARDLLFAREDPIAVPFAPAFALMSSGVVVHSEYMGSLVRRDCPDVSVRNIVMGVTSVPEPESREALRQRYGFGPDDFLLASLSTLSSRKRLEFVLGAIRDARARAPGVLFLIVGGGALGARARDLIQQYGLRDAVIQTGWVSSEQYRDYLSLADAVIDMRDISGAETANSLLRAIAAGLPAIVPGEGPFLELPDTVCIKLPLGESQGGALAEAAAELSENPRRRDEMARAAREYGRTDLDLKNTASQYMEFIEELAARPAKPATLQLPPAPSAASALVVSATYKLFRIGFLYRQYGVSDMLKRVGSELRTTLKGGA